MVKFNPQQFLTNNKSKYPSLFVKDLTKQNLVLAGQFKFRTHYEPKKEKIIPFSSAINNQYYIADSYDIEITFGQSVIPVVKEVSGRIQRLAKQLGVPEIDLHSKEGIACLTVYKGNFKEYYLEDLNNELLDKFLERSVIPFFYAQSYFEKFDKWPWRNYSHGVIGCLEALAENPTPNNTRVVKEYLDKYGKLVEVSKIKQKLSQYKIREHRKCICGSKRKFRNCHKLAMEGLKIYKQGF